MIPKLNAAESPGPAHHTDPQVLKFRRSEGGREGRNLRSSRDAKKGTHGEGVCKEGRGLPTQWCLSGGLCEARGLLRKAETGRSCHLCTSQH